MKRHKWISTCCLTVVFSMAVGLAWSAPQDQEQTPSTAEVDAYQAARSENDTQAKLKLLDDFVTKYPHSALLPEIYRDYYQTYFAAEDYPQVINYADKLLDFGDKVDVDSRILALVSREVAYSVSCGDPDANTPGLFEGQRRWQIRAATDRPMAKAGKRERRTVCCREGELLNHIPRLDGNGRVGSFGPNGQLHTCAKPGSNGKSSL